VKATGGDIKIIRKGDGFTVSAPFCKLTVQFWSFWLQLYIPSTIGSKVEGLCGNCNGISSDDLLPKEGSKDKNFFTSFSVPDDSGIHYQAYVQSTIHLSRCL
jgi:hypothetical protein